MATKGSVQITLSDKLASGFGKELNVVLAEVAKKLTSMSGYAKTMESALKKTGEQSSASMGKLSTSLSSVTKLIIRTEAGLKEIDNQVKAGGKSINSLTAGYQSAATALAKMKAEVDASRAAMGNLDNAEKKLQERGAALDNASVKLGVALAKNQGLYKAQVVAIDSANAATKKFETTTAQMAKSLQSYSAAEEKHKQNITNITASIEKGTSTYAKLAAAQDKRANSLRESIRFEEAYVKALIKEAGVSKEAAQAADLRAKNLDKMKTTLEGVERAQAKATEQQKRYNTQGKEAGDQTMKLSEVTGKLVRSYDSLIKSQKDLIDRERQGLATTTQVTNSYSERVKKAQEIVRSIEAQIAASNRSNTASKEEKVTLSLLNNELKKAVTEKNAVVASAKAHVDAVNKTVEAGKKEATNANSAAKAYDTLLSGMRNVDKEYKLLINNLKNKAGKTSAEIAQLKATEKLYNSNKVAIAALTSAHRGQSAQNANTAMSTQKLSQAMMLAGGNISRMSYGLSALASIGPVAGAALVTVIAAVSALAVAFKAASLAIDFFKSELTSSAKEFSEFERIVMGAVAVTGEGSEAFYQLGDAARQTALDFTFSSKEIAQGFITLGQAGFSATESLKSIRSVAELAQATFSTLASSADLVTTTIRAFGLEVSESDRLAQLFAASINNSKTTLDGLRTAFNFVAVSASQIGLSVEQTAAALGTLNNAGLKASTAATGLRGIFGKLLAPTEKFRTELEKVGLTVEDVDPRIHGIVATLKRMRDAGFDVQSAYAGLDKRIAAAATALITNVDSFEQLERRITGTSDATVNAALQMSTLAGKTTILRNTIENLRIGIGDELSPGLKDLVTNLTEVLQNNDDLVAGFVGLSNTVIALGNYIVTSFDAIGNKAEVLSSSFMQLEMYVKAFAGASVIFAPLVVVYDKLKKSMLGLVEAGKLQSKTASKMVADTKKQLSANKSIVASYQETIDKLNDLNATEEVRSDTLDTLIETLEQQEGSEQDIIDIYEAQARGVDDLTDTLEKLRLKKEEVAAAASFKLYTLSILNNKEAFASLLTMMDDVNEAINNQKSVINGSTDASKRAADQVLRRLQLDEQYRRSLQGTMNVMSAAAIQEADRATSIANETGNQALLISKIEALVLARKQATESQKIVIDTTLVRIAQMTDSFKVYSKAVEVVNDLTFADKELRKTLVDSGIGLGLHEALIKQASDAYADAGKQVKGLNDTIDLLVSNGASGSEALNSMRVRADELGVSMLELVGEFKQLGEESLNSAATIDSMNVSIANSVREYGNARRKEIRDNTEELAKAFEERRITNEEYLMGIRALETEHSNVINDQIKHKSDLIIAEADKILAAEKASLEKRLDSEKKYGAELVGSVKEYTILYLALQKKKRDAAQDVISELAKEAEAFRKTYESSVKGLDSSVKSLESGIAGVADTYNSAAGKIVKASAIVEDGFRSMVDAESAASDANMILSDGLDDLSTRFPVGKRGSEEYAEAVERLAEASADAEQKSLAAGSAASAFGSTLENNKESLGTSAYKKYTSAIRGVGSTMSTTQSITEELNSSIKEGSSEAFEKGEDSLNKYREKLDSFNDLIAAAEQSQKTLVSDLSSVGISLDGNIDKFVAWEAEASKSLEKTTEKLNGLNLAAGSLKIVLEADTDNATVIENTNKSITDLAKKAKISVKVVDDPVDSFKKLETDYTAIKDKIEREKIEVKVHLELDEESQKFMEDINATVGGGGAVENQRWGGGVKSNTGRKVPTMLERGEFVISSPVAKSIGTSSLSRMNRTGEAPSGEGVAKFARGGRVGRGGYGGGDRIPALLEDGEFVIRKEAARNLGLDNLENMNNQLNGNLYAKMAFGGLVRGLGISTYVKDVVDSALTSQSSAVAPDMDALVDYASGAAGKYVMDKQYGYKPIFIDELSSSGPDTLFEWYSTYRDAYIKSKNNAPVGSQGYYGNVAEDKLNDLRSVINGYFKALGDALSDQYGVRISTPTASLNTSTTELESMHTKFLQEAAKKIMAKSPVQMMEGGNVLQQPGSIGSAAMSTMAALTNSLGSAQNLGSQVKNNEVPALLEAGEFVFNKDIVRKLGLSNLMKMNAGKMMPQKYHDGGLVTASGSGSMPSAAEVSTNNLNVQMDFTFKSLDSDGAEDFVQNTLLPKMEEIKRLQGAS